jgi:hypothetical protein
MVSVLAIGPKLRVFKPGRADGFLNEIKSSARLSWEWKYRQRLHVVRFYGM